MTSSVSTVGREISNLRQQILAALDIAIQACTVSQKPIYSRVHATPRYIATVLRGKNATYNWTMESRRKQASAPCLKCHLAQEDLVSICFLAYT
jgi:hypothetical protein